MAEKREIIIEIEVDNNQAQKNLERTTSQIRTLQNERKELNNLIKKSDSELRSEGTTRKEVNKQIVENGLATKRLSDEKRRATKEVNLENNSLNALRDNLSKLTNERNSVNTGTAEGAKRFRELNKEILAQNEAISDLEEAGGDFRRNVGNYGSAIDSVIPGFSGLTTGIIGATRASLAFIATPIGAILGALGLALGAVVTYFTKTQKGAEQLRVITAGLSVGMDILTEAIASVGEFLVESFQNPAQLVQDLGDTLQNFVIKRVTALVDGLGLLGSAIAKVFKGDFEGALNDAKDGATKLLLEVNPLTAMLVDIGKAGAEAFDDIAAQAIVAAVAAGKLEAELIKIEKAENDLILTRSEANRIVKEQNKIAEDTSKTLGERTIAAEKAIAAEQSVLTEELRIAKERARIIKEQNALTDTSTLEEDRKREIEAIARVNDLQTASFELQTTLQNKLNILRQQQKAIDDKIVDDKAKQDAIDKADQIKKAEKEKELQQREIDASIELQEFKQSQREFDAEAEIELEKTKSERLLENTELVESEKQLIKEESNAKILAIQKKAVDNEIKEQERQISQTSALFGNLSSVVKSLGVEFKGFAIAQAVVDTYAAANAALRSGSLLSPLAGVAAAAGAVVTGLANVATIKNQKFANGGLVQGASHANGGVKFAVGGRVNELEGGEAVINKRSTRMFAPVLSAINQAGGGVKFANGGVTGFGSASGIDSEISGQNQIMSLINSLPSPIVRVTDINDTQNTVKVTQETASL